jgi:hypothetical protein
MPLSATQIDHDSAALPFHASQGVLGHVGISGKIDIDHPTPLLDGHFVQRHIRIGRLNRRVVDKHIQAAELLDGPINDNLAIGFARGVGTSKNNIRGKLSGIGFVDVGADNGRGTGPGEGHADRSADPLAAACDQDDSTRIIVVDGTSWTFGIHGVRLPDGKDCSLSGVVSTAPELRFRRKKQHSTFCTGLSLNRNHRK